MHNEEFYSYEYTKSHFYSEGRAVFYATIKHTRGNVFINGKVVDSVRHFNK
jgi:hypothetical protein